MYRFAKIVHFILMHAPLWCVLLLGKALGLGIYCIPKKRRIAFKNIKLVFPQRDNRQLRKILRRSFINFGLSIVESFIAPRIFKYVELQGKENIKGKGHILTGIHEGSWEVTMCFLAKEFDYAILARQQKNAGLNRLLNETRSAAGLKVCFSIKELLQYVRKDYFIGLAVDHGAQENMPFVSFFNHLVPTPNGAPYLAKKFGKAIHPSFVYRKRNFRQCIEIGPRIEVENKSEEEVLQQINSFYEAMLDKYPQEYIWTFKRFKRKKDLEVVILNDGRLGHLKQSQALLAFLREEHDYIKEQTIDVKYKNRITRLISEACAVTSGRKSCIGCGRCLKLLLKKETYTQLLKVNADLVISAGSLCAPINRILSAYLGAKSVAILKPNLPLRGFNTVILPEHDRVQTSNTLVIKGALSYPGDFEKKAKECKDFFNLGDDKKISVFIGASLRNKERFLSNLTIFIKNLKEFSLNKGYKLLISTSRRTDKETEDILEREFENFSNTEAIVYANRKNYDFVFEGFVALSDTTFVTSESISMISETASLRKPCVCVALEGSLGKHGDFIDSVKNEMIFLENPYNIEGTSISESSLFDYNSKVIKSAIRKLL